MTRHEKLIDRIRARPPEADFEDVRTLLKAYGWLLDRQRGSLATFVKTGERSLTVPMVSGRRVKRVYLDQILELLGLNEERNDR